MFFQDQKVDIEHLVDLEFELEFRRQVELK